MIIFSLGHHQGYIHETLFSRFATPSLKNYYRGLLIFRFMLSQIYMKVFYSIFHWDSLTRCQMFSTSCLSLFLLHVVFLPDHFGVGGGSSGWHDSHAYRYGHVFGIRRAVFLFTVSLVLSGLCCGYYRGLCPFTAIVLASVSFTVSWFTWCWQWNTWIGDKILELWKKWKFHQKQQ